MKKLNKFAAALAAMVMALSFAGCSDNEEKDSGFDPSEVKAPAGSKLIESAEDVAALELAGNWKLTGDYIAQYVNDNEISRLTKVDDITEALLDNGYWGINDDGVVSGSHLKAILGIAFYDGEEGDDDYEDYGIEHSSGSWFAVSADFNTLYGYMWTKITYKPVFWEYLLAEFSKEYEQDFKSKKELFDYLKGLSDDELDKALDELEMDKSDIELIDKYWGASSDAGAIKFTFTKQS